MAMEKKEAAIRSFVFFDTETTGLPSPGNRPKITELSFVALTREELLSRNCAPRALNKLTLCFNPGKRIGVHSSIITGLYNDSLELMGSFKNQASLVTSFLQLLPKPACLVAHNGNSFDFPLLIAELLKAHQEVPGDVLCVDSLEAFRALDGLPPVPDHVLEKRQREKLALSSRVTETGHGDGVKHRAKNSLSLEAAEGGDVVTTAESGGVSLNSDSDRPKGEDSGDEPPLKRSRLDGGEEVSVSSDGPVLCGDPGRGGWHRGEHTPVRKLSAPHPDRPEACRGPGVRGILGSETRRQLFPATVAATDGEGSSERTDHVSQNAAAVTDRADRRESHGGRLGGGQGSDEHEEKNVRKESGEGTAANVGGAGSGLRDSPEHKVGTAETKVSYKLVEVYARMFGQVPDVSHTAEDDCVTMLRIAQVLSTPFVHWCNRNAVRLTSVEAMY
ncbi:uncharacterized protein LOC106012576 [Aplysia californica]|uniref:Uncharacterized protein LOC106012576 n=1 Tax=Aplysia californica TaxID=6500 RepID=A0ABM1A5T2_APLCA|nr:uncharacterized protein LOC106012576 [Aplysia californica]